MRPMMLVGVGVLVVAACAGSPPSDAPFELQVAPSEYMPIMPEQRFVVLASAIGGSDPVTMHAEVDGAAEASPSLVDAVPGEVTEFTVVADASSIDTTLTLRLRAERGATEQLHEMNLSVVDWTDDLQPMATELRERFVAYLAQNHPDFGITAVTEWEPTITKPQILVVMHYLFFSEDWEMGIMWHVTVPEHAWSRMYLRPRDGMVPTFGLEIPSYPDPGSQPAPWEPPAEIDR